MTFVFLPVIWYITDRVIEPRLVPIAAGSGSGGGTAAAEDSDKGLSDDERRGLKLAGFGGSRCCGPLGVPVYRPRYSTDRRIGAARIAFQSIVPIPGCGLSCCLSGGGLGPMASL